MSSQESSDELRAAARRERLRLEAVGEIDSVADAQLSQKAPAFGDLLGRYIEVRWRYWDVGDDGKRKSVYIWCEGEVVEVADGTKKRTPQCKAPLLHPCLGVLCASGALLASALVSAAPLTPARACSQVAR